MSEAAAQRTYAFGSSTLNLVFGDITTSTADAIVSSDNYLLTMGGGVSAAIRRAGGEAILVDATKRIPAKLGDVIVTTAGNLPAAYVFHAVTIDGDGPAEDTSAVLEGAVRRSFNLMDTLALESIAFSAIGAGAAGFAYEDVAVQMAATIAEAFGAADRPIEASIYLFDRFGRMSEIDFVRFFEEFAKRASQFSEVAQAAASAVEIERVAPTPVGAGDELEGMDQRQALVRGLSELGQRRHELERRLVRLEGGSEHVTAEGD